MFERLNWQADRATLGDVVFRLEQSRDDSWELGDDCFRLFKNRHLIDQFDLFWSSTDFRPRRMLEIGIWDGGSTALWFEHLKPERIVAIDSMDREDSAYFQKYVTANGLEQRVMTRWRTNQASRAALLEIVERDLGGELDFVIDDGSHLLGPTRASFETLFPLLPPGGLYIIEDWAWEHWPEFQDPKNFWANEESPAPLLNELVGATGSSKTLIRRLSVHEGFVAIERGEGEALGHDFKIAGHVRRRPWRAEAVTSQSETDVKVLAFYLPQFYPIPENDRWWGKGFTEWARTARARPQFDGHYQPHVPERLGFYDLRLAETRARQAELARTHGIHGFCYYYYALGSKNLLDRPLKEMLASGDPDLPFCFCWANENWTRRWDGAEKQMLVEQRYGPELDVALVEDMLPYFLDRRYVRVAGKPVLLVYRPGSIPEPHATIERWRATARKHGLPGLHVVAALTFGIDDPRPLGFDAAVEFPPHGAVYHDLAVNVDGKDPAFNGTIVDYRAVAERHVTRPPQPFHLYRTAMAGWDNTPRHRERATVFHNASPDVYEWWLRQLVAAARVGHPDHRLVFVNAWNEWAEGAHLEPDLRFGAGYLEATRRALAV